MKHYSAPAASSVFLMQSGAIPPSENEGWAPPRDEDERQEGSEGERDDVDGGGGESPSQGAKPPTGHLKGRGRRGAVSRT